jgi:hypothetical protein
MLELKNLNITSANYHYWERGDMKTDTIGRIIMFVFILCALALPPNSTAIASVPGESIQAQVAAPAVPANLAATEVVDPGKSVRLTWQSSPEMKTYKVYRSRTQGSYSSANLVKSITFGVITDPLEYLDTGADKAFDAGVYTYYYVVTAVDSQNVESGYSNEVSALPHYRIFWAGDVSTYHTPNLTDTPVSSPWTYTLGDPTNVYYFAGEVLILGQTGEDYGPETDVIAQVGFSEVVVGQTTVNLTQWTNWTNAAYKDTGKDPSKNHDRHSVPIAPTEPGEFYYTYRFSTTAGREWNYPFLDQFGFLDPSSIKVTKLDKMIVQGNPDDTVSPTSPVLSVTGHTATTVSLSWTESVDANLYAYDVYRSLVSGSLGERVNPTRILAAQSRTYTDTNLVAGTQYYYTVVALDRSFNRGESNQVGAQTNSNPITFTLRVTIPSFTPNTSSVYINRLIDAGTNLPGGESWTAKAMSCSFTTYDCTVSLTIQQNAVLNFRFSRGSQATVQTMADGNTSAVDPSFSVLSGISGTTVNRNVANWDDPLVIDYFPQGGSVNPQTKVTITWNQSMAPGTPFVFQDMGSDGSGPATTVAGSFAYNDTTSTEIFSPSSMLNLNWHYHAGVSGKVDPHGISQQVPYEWDFVTGDYFFYLPVVRK